MQVIKTRLSKHGQFVGIISLYLVNFKGHFASIQKLVENGSEANNSDLPSLQRRSSQVSYATVNGVTVPNYHKNLQGKPPTGKKATSQATSEKSNFKKQINEEIVCMPRPDFWPEPDIIVLCYSSVDIHSIKQIEAEIWPELAEKYPGIPVILVATKCDAREDTDQYNTEEFWQIDEDSAASKSKPRKPFFVNKKAIFL